MTNKFQRPNSKLPSGLEFPEVYFLGLPGPKDLKCYMEGVPDAPTTGNHSDGRSDSVCFGTSEHRMV